MRPFRIGRPAFNELQLRAQQTLWSLWDEAPERERRTLARGLKSSRSLQSNAKSFLPSGWQPCASRAPLSKQGFRSFVITKSKALTAAAAAQMLTVLRTLSATSSNCRADTIVARAVSRCAHNIICFLSSSSLQTSGGWEAIRRKTVKRLSLSSELKVKSNVSATNLESKLSFLELKMVNCLSPHWPARHAITRTAGTARDAFARD